MRHKTPFGRVDHDEHGTTIRGSRAELEAWATRPGARWPGSQLRRLNRVFVAFDVRGNLEDIDHPGADDLDAHELDAWTTDVLDAAGLTTHPARRT